MFEAKNLTIPSSPVLRPTKRPQYYREVLFVIAAIALVAQLFPAYRYYQSDLQPWTNTSAPANSTLGFGAIYAVSRNKSPRQPALISAANLTGLDIRIPNQPAWTDQDVIRVKAPINSSVDRGSALAWLGHLNALEEFLASSHETALILEDDVDWDVRLRQEQIPQTAYAIRELLGEHYYGYYGSPQSWDVLWLGHCGDFFNVTTGANLTSIKSYEDPTMPDFENLHEYTRDFMKGIGATHNHQRLVHRSVRPLCTFAYAVTRSSAQRIVEDLAVSEPVRPEEHPCKAFDVRLLEGCRDEGLRCISVNPELFHHQPGFSEVELLSYNPYALDTDQYQSTEEVPTNNVRCSARSKQWKSIRDSITDASIDADMYVRELAELSSRCHIDGL